MSLLEHRARSWRRQWAAGVAAEAGVKSIGLATMALSGALWLDQLAALSQPARWTLWWAAVAGLCAAGYFWWIRPLLRFDWSSVFAAAAAAFPELRESLKAAWELGRRAPAPGVSPELGRAHVERTEAALARLPRRRVFSPRLSPAARAAALAAFAAALALWPLRASPSWERLLRPWRDVALERFLSVIPGDAELERGKPARLSARWAAASPVAAQRQALRLWIRGPQGWREAPWDLVGPAFSSYEIESLTEALDYRLSWRGLRSRVYRLAPMTVPQLESLRVAVSGPQSEVVALSGAQPLSAIRGAWLTVTGTPSEPLARAQARLSSWPVPLPMKSLANGDWQASFALREDAELSFDVETAAGRKDAHPPVYQLKALADEPPRIDLLSPTEPLQASPRDSIPIAYSARDDGGLTRVSLLLWPAGRPMREILIDRPQGRRELAGDAALDLSELPLGRLEFQLKALDNAAPPQAGFSAKGVVEIADLEAAHVQTESQWLKAEDSLKALSEREIQAQALAAAARGDELAQKQAELSSSWDHASRDLRDLASQMASDAYANPGLADQAKAAAEVLAQAAQRRLPRAAEAARRGDFPAARQEHEQLARQVESARRMLAEGRKVQGLQDVFSETGRMSQAASDLQSALQAPAATGNRVPSEQTAKLQKALDRLRKQIEGLAAALSKLPKASAESGQGQSKSYHLPLEQARQSADALAKALASGDYAAAEKLAQQLADELAQAQRGLEQAAEDMAASGPDSQALRELEQAQGLWSEVIDDQTRAMEQTQRLEDDRLSRTMQAQRDLLATLAQEQSALVSSVSARGSSFPQDALRAMRIVEGEFSSRKVLRSDSLLAAVSALLRSEPGARDSGLEAVAGAEDGIRRRLEQGVQAKASADGARDAAKSQAQVREKTAGLERRLEALDASLPDGAMDGLQGAQSEQKSAEGALGGGDSSRALASQQKALEMLEQGSQQLSQAAGARGRQQSAVVSPFQRPGSGSRPGGGSGSMGAKMTFVPLPSAKDYRPAPQIRQELEKSLREPRPESFDGVIKEYFKRIAQ